VVVIVVVLGVARARVREEKVQLAYIIRRRMNNAPPSQLMLSHAMVKEGYDFIFKVP
jgi:hypothetical protein